MARMHVSSRVIVLLAALAVVVVTARLGLWQLDRAAQKNALQSQIEARRALPPLSPDALATTAGEAPAQHDRRIALQGRWMAEATVYLDNRPMHGRAGFIVVTPLSLADGTAVAVQRGWVARDARDPRRVVLPPSARASGDVVRIEGRIAPAPSRWLDLGNAPPGPIRQNLDLPSYARETRLKLRPLTVLQLADAGGADSAVHDGLLRDWPAPAADVHKNYGYALQWFALCALTIGLYVWFQLIVPRRARRGGRDSPRIG